MKKLIITSIAAMAFAGAASAQTGSLLDGWSGEGNLGAGITTGNTDTVDVGVALKLAKKFGLWQVGVDGGYDFGQVDGIDNRNRWWVGSHAQRDFTDRLYGFGDVSYEEDQFSGFDSRLFLGVGAGYHIYKDKPLTWSVEVAPGFRRSVLDTIPQTTANDFAAQGSSKLAYEFNENVTFTNDTDVIYTRTSTQTINTAAITAQLTEKISGRVSFQVRHETDPPAGFVNTDTATRASVVYSF
jgi:putative salt-induced outer membrane protein